MTKEKDKTQSAKAARLHEKIEEIKQRSGSRERTSPGEAAAPTRTPSPRDFIHRRMRELNEKKNEKK